MRAVHVIESVNEVNNDFGDVAQNLAGPLTISAPRDFSVTFLQSSLLAFKNYHPEIILLIYFDDRTANLGNETYDFTVRITDKIDENLSSTQIGKTRHQLCATPAYLEVNTSSETLEQLKFTTFCITVQPKGRVGISQRTKACPER